VVQGIRGYKKGATAVAAFDVHPHAALVGVHFVRTRCSAVATANLHPYPHNAIAPRPIRVKELSLRPHHRPRRTINH